MAAIVASVPGSAVILMLPISLSIPTGVWQTYRQVLYNLAGGHPLSAGYEYMAQGLADLLVPL